MHGPRDDAHLFKSLKDEGRYGNLCLMLFIAFGSVAYTAYAYGHPAAAVWFVIGMIWTGLCFLYENSSSWYPLRDLPPFPNDT